MREIKLTQNKVAIVDDEDFEYLNQWKWYFNKGYAVRGSSIRILMHRVIAEAQQGKDVDHINRNALDNRRSNLRICSRGENCRNSKARTTSGIKGIYWTERLKKWQVSICLNYKQNYIGVFENRKDAIVAYNEAAKKLHGEFAALNQI